MKTTRRIEIADHLWETFGRMAEEMGADRDVLVNQAMHAFARQNGLDIAVRGGGHHIAGHSVCDGGLMIDFSAMKNVRVDAGARRAYVEPGGKCRNPLRCGEVVCMWAGASRQPTS